MYVCVCVCVYVVSGSQIKRIIFLNREWIQRDYQKSWLTGNLKEGKNEAVLKEPGKMGYVQHWVKET